MFTQLCVIVLGSCEVKWEMQRVVCSKKDRSVFVQYHMSMSRYALRASKGFSTSVDRVECSMPVSSTGIVCALVGCLRTMSSAVSALFPALTHARSIALSSKASAFSISPIVSGAKTEISTVCVFVFRLSRAANFFSLRSIAYML